MTDLNHLVDSVWEPSELMSAMARFPIIVWKSIPFQPLPACDFCPVHAACTPLDSVAIISYRFWIEPVGITAGYYTHMHQHYSCGSCLEWELHLLTKPGVRLAEDLTVEILMIREEA